MAVNTKFLIAGKNKRKLSIVDLFHFHEQTGFDHNQSAAVFGMVTV